MDVVQQVKALHSQGVSIAEIARQCGISRPTVYKYLALNEQPARGRPANREPQGIACTHHTIDSRSIVELFIAVCWQAHEDNDQEWLQPIQDDAKILLENRANDHIARWVHGRVGRHT